MSENYEELMKQVGNSVKASFSTKNGIDSFFQYVLDGFAYRYIKDDKSSDVIIEKVGDHIYQATTVTVSMKSALELVTIDKKNELINAIKEAMTGKRATTLFQIKVDTSSLNSDGQGKIQAYSIINWDFPNHQDVTKGLLKEFSYESEDWDHLRKNFPLFLEQVCEVF